MTDIFHEVEEEVRRERFEKLWQQYGDYVVAFVALVVIAVAGWQIWTRYEDNQRLKASENLIAAQQLAGAGDPARASEALSTVAKNAPSGYAEMARLTEAGVLLSSGKRDEAIDIYKSIAADDHGQIGSVALIRAGWAMAEFSPRADIEALLKPLDQPGNPWHGAAREILAYADYRSGLFASARSEFDALAKDADASEAMRRRAEVMADFIKNGGLNNYGTVPKPPPPPAPTVKLPDGTETVVQTQAPGQPAPTGDKK